MTFSRRSTALPDVNWHYPTEIAGVKMEITSPDEIGVHISVAGIGRVCPVRVRRVACPLNADRRHHRDDWGVLYQRTLSSKQLLRRKRAADCLTPTPRAPAAAWWQISFGWILVDEGIRNLGLFVANDVNLKNHACRNPGFRSAVVSWPTWPTR
jgi:hypothetical protein